jgi:hypothetical protein
MPHSPKTDGTPPEDPAAKRIRERMERIRGQLDAPFATEALRRLTVRQDVMLDPLKDKIAEVLEALVGQRDDFNRERVLREECDRVAGRLGRFRHLDDSVRRRPLQTYIKGVTRRLERRADGIERLGGRAPLLHEDGKVHVGPVEIREYGRGERSDRQYVYDLAVLDLYGVLRHLTEEDDRGEVARFETISYILQAVEVIPMNAKGPEDAVRKRFNRANQWPEGLFTKTPPPPVYFREYFLFSIDPRFPRQAPRLDSSYYAATIGTPGPAPPAPDPTSER